MTRSFLLSFSAFTILTVTSATAQKNAVVNLFNSLELEAGQDSVNAAEIFNWITENVKYDVRAADIQDATGNPSKIQTPAKVVSNKRGICEGYANLFLELCEHAEIECKKVVGYVADAERKFYQRANLESHAWNALKIDDTWTIVDCTWGSGGVDEEKKFRFEQDYGYFMSNSETMAASHYPMDPVWQLRNDPIALSQFKDGETGPAQVSMEYSEVIEAQLGKTETDSIMFANERIISFDPSNTMALSEITMSFLNQAQQITVNQHNRLLHAQKEHLKLEDKGQYFAELEQIQALTEEGSEYLERMSAKGDQSVADYKRDARTSVSELQTYVKDQEKWLKQYFKNPRPL
jgi:hypothetical protein